MSLFKNSAVYMGSSLLSKAIPFFMLPYLTHALPTAEYGAAALILLYWSLTVACVGSNSHSALSRNYYKKSKDDISSYVTQIIYFNLVLLALVLAFTIGICIIFPEIIFPFGNYLLILPVLAFINCIYSFVTTLLRFEEQPIKYAIFEICYALIQAAAAILFIEMIGATWHYQLVSISMPLVILVSVAIVTFLPVALVKPNKTDILGIARLCSPQIVHVIGGVVLAIGDRYVLGITKGADEVGIYAAAYSICMAFSSFVDAYTRAYSPRIYKMLSDIESNVNEMSQKDAASLLVKSGVALFALSLLFLVSISFAYPLVVGEEFEAGIGLLPWLMLGMFLQSIYKLLFPYIVVYKLTGRIAVINILGAAVNIVGNVTLVPDLGMLACGYMTAFTYALIAIVTLLLSLPHFKYRRR